MESYDVIVIGLGGMGSAAAYRLAQRGLRVLGIEQYSAGHNMGSSHGGSRITLQAYFAGEAYVPLLLRTHELWRQIEADSGTDIFTACGGLSIGRPDSAIIAGGLASARKWDIPHEQLEAAEIRRRFPTMNPSDEDVAVYEPGAGLLVPETAVLAHLQLAAAAGAELHYEEKVLSWEQRSGGGVVVRTSAGEYTAGQLVVCPGAWAPDLLTDLGIEFEVERQVQYWFAPEGDVKPFLPENHPVYVWQPEDGRIFYGFPVHHGESAGAKVAFFRAGTPCSADDIDRTVTPEESAAMAEFVRERVPSLPGKFLRAVPCLYTNTPDQHAVIARHPAHESVVVACGFSGHGFKFVPVVGEILADLVTQGTTAHDISLFDPARFASAAS
jgi:sarcosine oxidase